MTLWFDPMALADPLRHADTNALASDLDPAAHRDALAAWLRTADDGDAFRTLFALLAPRLSADAAWAIATDAIDRFGDGDAGARTRWHVRSVALARWAGHTGEGALPDVLAAISDDASLSLNALIALARQSETDRARVLAEARPYWKHSGVSRVPVLAAQALQALGATSEEPGVPREIVQSWELARLTESTIMDRLAEHGLVVGTLAPSGAFGRLVGRGLVVDVLVRAGVAAMFDAESGTSAAA